MGIFFRAYRRVQMVPESKRRVMAIACMIVCAGLLLVVWTTIVSRDLVAVSGGVTDMKNLLSRGESHQNQDDVLTPAGGVSESLKNIRAFIASQVAGVAGERGKSETGQAAVSLPARLWRGVAETTRKAAGGIAAGMGALENFISENLSRHIETTDSIQP